MSFAEKTKISNVAGTTINPATEEKQDTLITATQANVMAITNAINQTAYALGSTSFSATTNISNDYILDSVEFNFSTALSKTITITSADGTILWGGNVDTTSANLGYNTTKQNIFLADFNSGFNGGENITITVTQTSGACAMDCLLKVRSGSNNLLGDPTLGAGTAHIGSVTVDSSIPAGTNNIGQVGMRYYDVETAQWSNVQGAEGSPHTMSYTTAIAMGHIAGHTTFRGFGQRQGLSTAVTGDDVWEGTATTCPMPNQTTGERMTLVSTSASDASAGTGVRTIDLHYLDITGNAQSEIITLNGVTPVNTVATNIRFVQSIHSETVGSTGTAVGTISIYKTGSAGTVYNVIVPGGNMSLNSARMIPFGKTFYMTNLSFSGASNKAISIKLRSTSTFEDVVTTGYFFLFKDVTFIQNSIREKTFRVPLKFPALSVLKATAYSSQAGGDVSFNFDGWCE